MLTRLGKTYMKVLWGVGLALAALTGFEWRVLAADKENQVKCDIGSVIPSVQELQGVCKQLKSQRDKLVDEKKELLREKRDLLEEAALSSIAGMTPASICSLLHERGMIDDRDAAACRTADTLLGDPDDPRRTRDRVLSLDASRRIQAAIRRFQSDDTMRVVERDGWLKSDQFVELVCKGALEGKPIAMHYAGWMSATGAGLPQDYEVARYFLGQARDLLENGSSSTDVSGRRGNIRDLQAKIRNGNVADVSKAHEACARVAPARERAARKRRDALGELSLYAGSSPANVQNLSVDPSNAVSE